MATAEFSKFAGILSAACPVLALHNFHCTQCPSPDFIEITQLGRWHGDTVVFSPVILKKNASNKKKWQEYTEELDKKGLNDPDNRWYDQSPRARHPGM